MFISWFTSALVHSFDGSWGSTQATVCCCVRPRDRTERVTFCSNIRCVYRETCRKSTSRKLLGSDSLERGKRSLFASQLVVDWLTVIQSVEWNFQLPPSAPSGELRKYWTWWVCSREQMATCYRRETDSKPLDSRVSHPVCSSDFSTSCESWFVIDGHWNLLVTMVTILTSLVLGAQEDLTEIH